MTHAQRYNPAEVPECIGLVPSVRDLELLQIFRPGFFVPGVVFPICFKTILMNVAALLFDGGGFPIEKTIEPPNHQNPMRSILKSSSRLPQHSAPSHQPSRGEKDKSTQHQSVVLHPLQQTQVKSVKKFNYSFRNKTKKRIFAQINKEAVAKERPTMLKLKNDHIIGFLNETGRNWREFPWIFQKMPDNPMKLLSKKPRRALRRLIMSMLATLKHTPISKPFKINQYRKLLMNSCQPLINSSPVNSRDKLAFGLFETETKR